MCVCVCMCACVCAPVHTENVEECVRPCTAVIERHNREKAAEAAALGGVVQVYLVLTRFDPGLTPLGFNA